MLAPDTLCFTEKTLNGAFCLLHISELCICIFPSTWTHDIFPHPPYSWTLLSNATIISLIYGKRSIPRWCCWYGSSKWLRTCNDIESRGMPFIAVVDKGTTEDAKKARTTTRITAQDKSSNRLTGRVGHKCPLLKADDWHAGDLHRQICDIPLLWHSDNFGGGWAIASKSDKKTVFIKRGRLSYNLQQSTREHHTERVPMAW